MYLPDSRDISKQNQSKPPYLLLARVHDPPRPQQKFHSHELSLRLLCVTIPYTSLTVSVIIVLPQIQVTVSLRKTLKGNYDLLST